jgi:hypothetical protein
LLQILFVAALDIKTRDVPTVSSVNSLLSQYCKASQFFFVANFYVPGGAPTVRFAPVVPWAKTGPGYHQEFLHFCNTFTEQNRCKANYRSDGQEINRLP